MAVLVSDILADDVADALDRGELDISPELCTASVGETFEEEVDANDAALVSPDIGLAELVVEATVFVAVTAIARELALDVNALLGIVLAGEAVPAMVFPLVLLSDVATPVAVLTLLADGIES